MDIKQLLKLLEQRGYAGRVVSVEHLGDLRESIEANRRNGLLDDELYNTYLSGFVFSPPDNMPDAQAIIIVAARQPQMRFTFTHNGESKKVIVPPTYLHGEKTDGKVKNELEEILSPEGYRIAPVRLPKKLLAAHSGLSRYGKNNVTYVPEMGSFIRLNAFFSDVPCDGEDSWQGLTVMEKCTDCLACTRVCPSGAIDPGRFLLHAEKCIVFHNEKPANVPFPAWMDPAWHNCLVGCMLCQKACPENKGLIKTFEEGPEFTSEETALLMAGTPLDRLPEVTKKKLVDSDLVSLLDVIPRNLNVLSL